MQNDKIMQEEENNMIAQESQDISDKAIKTKIRYAI